MTEAPQPNPSDRSGGPTVRGAVALAVAGAVLASCYVVSRAVGWTEKLPVPWPETVRVDAEFRLLSFPERVGPFQAVQEGDPYYFRPKQPPGADNVFKKTDRDALGIGRASDARRYPERRSNWYLSRYYSDTRRQPGDPRRYWRLDLYYYTGARDPAPHVGEICIRAGGGEITSSEIVKFASPSRPVRPPWNDDVPFKRIVARTYRPGDLSPHQVVEYYVFAVNDGIMTNRLQVKRFLNSPRVTYSYFAKMQFAPVGAVNITDIAAADEAAADFVDHFLPAVLRVLPAAEDITKLRKERETSD